MFRDDKEFVCIAFFFLPDLTYCTSVGEILFDS